LLRALARFASSLGCTLTLRERLSEVEADIPEAFQRRRELVRLLVERITTDRDESGHPRVEITYRFDPPPEESFVPSVLNSGEYDTDNSRSHHHVHVTMTMLVILVVRHWRFEG
jgi:hypothetical protein